MAEHIPPPRVLVVDDQEEIRQILSHILEKEGFEVIAAPDGQQAMEKICFDTPDAVLLDVRMPGLSGMDVLKKIKAIDDNLPVVLVTAYADTHQAVEAMKEGAYDYLAKPFDNNEVVWITSQALAEGKLRRNHKSINDRFKGNFSLIESMGPSDKIGRLAVDVHRVAKSDFSVIIMGETGSGKELVARAIHGVMAGGIAHEIRNPLAICSSSAQFLMEEDGTPEFRRECAEKIHKGIQRTSAIIENLLKYSHPSTTTRTTLVNLASLIKETLTLVTYHANILKIDMKTSFPREPIMVQGVATLLQQVFMNLFLNAINAMPTGGRLGIEVGMINSEVRVQLTDTGCGIARGEIERIFDPFYTTSTVGKGTGLGLSLCHSIVQQHKGSITAEMGDQRGTKVSVRLPITKDEKG